MTIGEHGLHIESGHKKAPKNSIPMIGGQGPFDYITMGGPILKVRENRMVVVSDDRCTRDESELRIGHHERASPTYKLRQAEEVSAQRLTKRL